MKRMRGRNHRPNGGGGGGGGGFRNQQNGIPLNRNHVFDSSGPEMRIRGTAQQLFEKYTQLARDAASSGDRVLGEAYYQHAEHYFRILAAINAAQGLPPPGQTPQPSEPRQGDFAEPGTEQPRVEAQPRQEFRQDGNRDNREPRENRDNRGERRFDNRQPRPEFQPREQRQDRPERRDDRPERAFRDDRPERPFRQPQPPIADAPIDISSALEAELAAATGIAPTFEAQPVPVAVVIPEPQPEPRAIPIAAAAPPEPTLFAELPSAPVAEEAPAAPRPRPRGRPRTVKPAPEKASE